MSELEKIEAAARSLDDNETPLGRLDEALIVIDQLKRRRMKLIKEMEKRIDLSENQKIFIGQEYDLWRKVETLTSQVEGVVKAQLGRQEPYSADLEQSVLGAVILDSKPRPDGTPPAMAVVRPFLRPEHFYEPKHQAIYKACIELQGPLDMRTLANELRRRGEIESIGNSIYLAELTAKVSQAANVESHARVLVELAIKRAMIHGGSYIVHQAYEDERDVFALYEYARRQLTRIRSWIK